jgi:hypothetical protein
MLSKLPISANFEVSLQFPPKIINNETRKEYSFYSEAGYDLFIGCPFKSTQLIHQV